MALAITLTNISDEDFTHKWDGVPYTIKAGQSILLHDYIAIHLAKHLSMREMGKRNKEAIIDPSRDEYGNYTNTIFKAEMEKYLSVDTEEEETPEKLEMTILKKNKGGRPKKVVEEEFSDLKK